MTPYEFLTSLMIYCTRLGGSVTSYGRTPAHDHALRPLNHPPHVAWVGADVVYDARPTEELAVNEARAVGLKLLREVDHDHLQPLGWPPG